MFITVCGIISNGFLLVVFAVDPLQCLRSVSSGLILNLCIADLVTALMLFLWTTMFWIWASDKAGEVIFCFVWFGYSTSFLTIALLSLERYIAIRYIWCTGTIVTKRRSVCGVVVIWFISGISFIRLDLKNLGIHMFILSPVFELCVLAVITFYTKLWVIRQRHVLQQHRAHIKQEANLTKVVFALIVILVITTMPLIFFYQLLYGLILFCGHRCVAEAMSYLPVYLTPVFAVNFTLNPAIYGWSILSPKYRRSFAALCTILMRNPVRQKLDRIVTYRQRETERDTQSRGKCNAGYNRILQLTMIALRPAKTSAIME